MPLPVPGVAVDVSTFSPRVSPVRIWSSVLPWTPRVTGTVCSALFAPTTTTVDVVPEVVTAVAGTYSALFASPVITLTLTDSPGFSPAACLVRASVTP